MRVALVHNPNAGKEDHSDADLTKALRSAGHEVTHVVSRLKDLTASLQRSPCDLVVVAGGDGTVGKVACGLAGWQVPLSILPLGTANNTARALGLPRRPKKLAKSWHGATPVPFDLGLLSDGTLCTRFSEAVGFGVFAQTIALAKRQPLPGDVTETLKRHRKLFKGIAKTLAPRRYDIHADGQDLSGEYLLVEVMNVRYLGPRLDLSPESNPGDGSLELLLVGAEQRDALVNVSKAGHTNGSPLAVKRVAHARITAEDALLHRDGQLLRQAPGRRTFTVGVEPNAISYLR
ncbi:MAG TPA: diacylglycerol kinase family protein [Polyangiaceae bacterium]|nr:diacylglycerol kinase family protein [Polyangiaceae bacterium]